MDAWRRRSQPQLRNLIDAYGDTSELIAQAFDTDLESIYELLSLRMATTRVPPSLPYDRRISKLLVLCCKLSTEQYIYGRFDPGYDGSIDVLPSYASYSEILNRYAQVASFQGPETSLTQSFDLKIPESSDIHGEGPVGDSLNQLSETTHRFIQKSIQFERRDRVYMGFALASNRETILAFRGTQRSAEWLNDLLALPTPFVDPLSGQIYGRVHSGFMGAVKTIINPSPAAVLRRLNASLPCFIAGHSLGGAVATLTAINLALAMPDRREQIRLYTYASPRVGDTEFVQTHSQLVPNSYRITNLADMIPMFPPLKLNTPYVHVGQEWAFLSQQGDPRLNHRVDTYQYAVGSEHEAESTASEKYFNLRINWRRRR
jgi:predicted lipase